MRFNQSDFKDEGQGADKPLTREICFRSFEWPSRGYHLFTIISIALARHHFCLNNIHSGHQQTLILRLRIFVLDPRS